MPSLFIPLLQVLERLESSAAASQGSPSPCRSWSASSPPLLRPRAPLPPASSMSPTAFLRMAGGGREVEGWGSGAGRPADRGRSGGQSGVLLTCRALCFGVYENVHTMVLV